MTEGAPLARPSDELTTGLRSDRWSDHGLAGRQVTWIEWDSPFRETELAVGDVILGADGVPYDPRQEAILEDYKVGSFGESRYWQQEGRSEGDRLHLDVWREHERLAIEGPLAAAMFYFNADGRRALCPGGPDRHASDGFQGSWSGWYEDITKKLSFILNHGWRRGIFNSRQLLAELQEHEERVRHLAERYPGPFATTMAADFEAALECTRGTLWPAESIDLSYRERSQILAEKIRQVAGEAEAAFVEAVGERTIPAEPAPDPVEEDPESLAGKVVRIDRVGPRSMRMDAGRPWYVFGDPRRGVWFLDANSPSCSAFHEVVERYRLLVTTSLPETYRFYCTALPAPRMMVVDGRTATGLTLQLVAANVADRVFIRVGGEGGGGGGHFAGQELLADDSVALPAPEASPEEVLAACFTVLKMGRRDVWRQLFADWHLSRHWNGSFTYSPFSLNGPSLFHSAWDFARRELEKDLYDVRIVAVGPVETVLAPTADGPGPTIDECRVEAEHVGLFDGEYRSMKNTRLHRVWTLQRVDGGPWRIRDLHGL